MLGSVPAKYLVVGIGGDIEEVIDAIDGVEVG